MKKRLSKTIWYGSDVDADGLPLVPGIAENAEDLEGLHHGELFLHEGSKPSLWARTASDEVKKITGIGEDELDGYVTIDGDEAITGAKDFTGGLSVNGGPIVYESTSGYWKLVGDLIVTGGVTMYANEGTYTPSQIVDAIPFDNTTIWYNTETGKVEVIGGGGEEGATTLGALVNVGTWADSIPTADRIMVQKSGSSTWSSLLLSEVSGKIEHPLLWSGFSSGSWDGSSSATIEIPSKVSQLDNDSNYLTEITSSMVTTALGYTPLEEHQDIYTLTFRAGTFSAGSFTANSAAKTIYIPTYTSHLTNNSDFTTNEYVDETFVTIAGSEDVTGVHNFVNGLEIGGIPMSKYSNGVLYIEGDVVVSGGVTMYGTSGSASTIMDGVLVDGTTISKTNGYLEVIGGGGGGVSSWDDLEDIPSYLGTSGLANSLSITVGSNSAVSYNGSASKSVSITYSTLGLDDRYLRLANISSSSVPPTTGDQLRAGLWDATGGYASFVGTGYGIQMYSDTSHKAYIRTVVSGTADSWYQIITGKNIGSQSVAKASQLTNARNIWGQSFDGTDDVSGSMTGVGSITPSSNLSYEVGSSTAAFNKIWSKYVTSNTTLYIDSASGTSMLFTQGGSEVGRFNKTTGDFLVGTTTDSAKLTVGGDVYATSYSVNGITIKKATNGYLYIDGDVVINGGLTMYGTDGVSAPDVMDFLTLDESTLSIVDGKLTVIGGGSSGGGGTTDYSLTLQANGTTLATFNGSRAKTVNFNYSNLGLDSRYLKLSGGTLTGALSVPTLTITDTSLAQHIAFSRTNANYITAPSGGSIAFSTLGTTGIANSALVINENGSVYSGLEGSLGTSSYKWSNVYATTFTGDLSGNAKTATTASKLGTATLGSSTKPIYLSSGTATACSTYAGGTAVTLNNASKAASTASFYAPTSGGTSNYVLIGKGTTSAPTWTAQSNLSVGSATKATQDGNGNVISSTYLKLSGGTIEGTLEVDESVYASDGFVCTNVSQSYAFNDYGIIFGSSGTYGRIGTSKNKDIGIYAGRQIFLRPSSSSSASSVGVLINADGYVGIGTSSPSCELHVTGDILATGSIDSTSDINRKNVICNNLMSVESIAEAPSFLFSFTDDKKARIQLGSSAQYWQSVNPHYVKDNDGTLSMSYGNIALTCAISISKEVLELKERIKELENEIEQLKTA